LNYCAGKTYPVGEYSANGYGLYDMAGNAAEWVADWYQVYPGGNPTASDDFGQTKSVFRGGSWYDSGDDLRVANRDKSDPNSASYTIGFRCARSP
jgi:iron(II)-dependent oxidoreductase